MFQEFHHYHLKEKYKLEGTKKALLNNNDEILETQYFSVSGEVNKNNETNIFIETDIIDHLQIVTQQLETTRLVLGFMLDNEKRDLLN